MKRAIILIIALLIIGWFFFYPKNEPVRDVIPNNDVTEQPSEPVSTWTDIEEGLRWFEFDDPETFVRIELVEVDLEKFEFDVSHGESKLVSGWFDDLEGAKIVANGFYFHEDQFPSGLLMIDGEQIGDRSFDFDKTGFVQLEPEFLIVDTEVEELDPDLENGGQSYPFLITNQKPDVNEDSGLLARRTFIGIDQSGLAYLGIVPEDSISLYTLSNLLINMPIEWQTVINLDGGPSSGLVGELDQIDSYVPVPNVIFVRPR